MKTVQAILFSLISTGGRVEKADGGQAQDSGKVFGFGVSGILILALLVSVSIVCGIGLLVPVHAQNIDATLGGNTASECFYIISSAGDTLLTVRGDAKVGIGTTDPTEKLNVVGNARIDGALEVTGTQVINGDITVDNITLSSSDVRDNESINLIIDRDSNSATEALIVRHDGDAGPELFRVQENGNVGIGTTNPGTRLEVNGAISGFGIAPIGSILAWHRNAVTPALALPDGWAECDGSTVAVAPNGPLDPDGDGLYALPNLNGENRLVRGNTTSGGTGGSTTHTHTGTTGITDQGCDASSTPGDARAVRGHWHSFATDSADNLPPYFTVVWIMRVR